MLLVRLIFIFGVLFTSTTATYHYRKFIKSPVVVLRQEIREEKKEVEKLPVKVEAEPAKNLTKESATDVKSESSERVSSTKDEEQVQTVIFPEGPASHALYPVRLLPVGRAEDKNKLDEKERPSSGGAFGSYGLLALPSLHVALGGSGGFGGGSGAGLSGGLLISGTGAHGGSHIGGGNVHNAGVQGGGLGAGSTSGVHGGSTHQGVGHEQLVHHEGSGGVHGGGVGGLGGLGVHEQPTHVVGGSGVHGGGSHSTGGSHGGIVGTGSVHGGYIGSGVHGGGVLGAGGIGTGYAGSGGLFGSGIIGAEGGHGSGFLSSGGIHGGVLGSGGIHGSGSGSGGAYGGGYGGAGGHGGGFLSSVGIHGGVLGSGGILGSGYGSGGAYGGGYGGAGGYGGGYGGGYSGTGGVVVRPTGYLTPGYGSSVHHEEETTGSNHQGLGGIFGNLFTSLRPTGSHQKPAHHVPAGHGNYLEDVPYHPISHHRYGPDQYPAVWEYPLYSHPASPNRVVFVAALPTFHTSFGLGSVFQETGHSGLAEYSPPLFPTPAPTHHGHTPGVKQPEAAVPQPDTAEVQEPAQSTTGVKGEAAQSNSPKDTPQTESVTSEHSVEPQAEAGGEVGDKEQGRRSRRTLELEAVVLETGKEAAVVAEAVPNSVSGEKCTTCGSAPRTMSSEESVEDDQSSEEVSQKKRNPAVNKLEETTAGKQQPTTPNKNLDKDLNLRATVDLQTSQILAEPQRVS